jgi:hypothetical protein
VSVLRSRGDINRGEREMKADRVMMSGELEYIPIVLRRLGSIRLGDDSLEGKGGKC